MLDGTIDTDTNDTPTDDLPSKLAKRSLNKVIENAEKAV
jgi:hypothetical protein